MHNWYLCKARYAKENSEGLLKNVTEQYLVDAVSFSEAETIMYDRVANMVRGYFKITHESESNYVDVFTYPDSDLWHSVKISYIVADGDTGKEKKVTQMMLVTANDCKQAYDRIQESLSNMLVSFRITEIKETAIIEVFPFEKKEVENG